VRWEEANILTSGVSYLFIVDKVVGAFDLVACAVVREIKVVVRCLAVVWDACVLSAAANSVENEGVVIYEVLVEIAVVVDW